MLRAFSTAATGMSAQQMMVDVIANNLANINTSGFKKSQVDFQDLLYVSMQKAGSEVGTGAMAPGGVEIGSGVRPASTVKVFTQGELENTGNPLNCAIQGDGFFMVTTPSGDTRYTRDGAFFKGADGALVTASGYPLSPSVSIPADVTEVDISPDGSVNGRSATGVSVVGHIQRSSQHGQPRNRRSRQPPIELSRKIECSDGHRACGADNRAAGLRDQLSRYKGRRRHAPANKPTHKVIIEP